MKLTDKIVLITGASSGIGKACSFDFASAGAKLILCARRIKKLESLAIELKQTFHSEVHILQLDVSDFNSVQSAITSLPDSWENIDILINNAGLARGFSKIYEGDIDAWEEMINTNIKGLAYVTREVLAGMVNRGKGHIINIGSTAGHETYTFGNIYSATKFAVKALTQSTRLDVLDKGIRVTSVDPGMVETEFSTVRFYGDEERAKKVYEGLTPLAPEDVSSAVLFCATRPENVNINEMILTPLAQASSTQVIRKTEKAAK
jgi:3-hydroxy acid dehydrogenase / malonic semialdehyde reductase